MIISRKEYETLLEAKRLLSESISLISSLKNENDRLKKEIERNDRDIRSLADSFRDLDFPNSSKCFIGSEEPEDKIY